MDIGKIESWVQLAIWGVAAVLFAGRLIRGETAMPVKLRKFFASNVLLGSIILAGLVMSGVTWYSVFHDDKMHFAKGEKIEEVSDQIFANQVIDLDGKDFRHCTFINVKLLYNGRTPIRLENDTFKGGLILNTDNDAVGAAWALVKAVGFTSMPMFGPDMKPLPGISGPMSNQSQSTQPQAP